MDATAVGPAAGPTAVASISCVVLVWIRVQASGIAAVIRANCKREQHAAWLMIMNDWQLQHDRSSLCWKRDLYQELHAKQARQLLCDGISHTELSTGDSRIILHSVTNAKTQQLRYVRITGQSGLHQLLIYMATSATLASTVSSKQFYQYRGFFVLKHFR